MIYRNQMNTMIIFILSILITTNATPLEDLILEKENILYKLAGQVRQTYDQDRCNWICDCSHLACESSMDGTCTDTFGSPGTNICSSEEGCQNQRRLNFDKSAIRLPRRGDATQEHSSEICWSQSLDSVFIQHENDDTLKWQYIGFPTGAYRIYPGVPQETCGSYDPRIRPWYVAATSGPKDVVIVVDVSGSMLNQNRDNIAKDAITTILDTLTLADHVNIVAFWEDSQILIGNHLLPARSENLEQLKQLIRDHPFDGWGTNFELGFRKAFNLLNNPGEFTSNCHKAILFLTDGQINGGLEGQALYDMISDLNFNKSTAVFTYSLGSGANKVVPKQIACSNDGTWAWIPDGGDLRGSMSQYYEYYSLLRRGDEQPTWTELYIDASGAGEMITGALGIYDHTTNPPNL